MSTTSHIWDNFNYKPRIGHKAGYCTTTYTKQVPCPSCKRPVYQVHQVERYNDRSVCIWCFDIESKKCRSKVE